jgi:hypothetical protein
MAEETVEEMTSRHFHEARNQALHHAIQIIELELLRHDVLDSKPACDALKRAIKNIEDLKS